MFQDYQLYIWLTVASTYFAAEAQTIERSEYLGKVGMNNSDQLPTNSNSKISIDVENLMKYRGQNLHREILLPSDVSILDYRNSDQNVLNISILLSSQGIPFHIDTPQKGWSQSKLRLSVSVPPEFVDLALALLTAATKAKVIEKIDGLQGLPGVTEKP